LDSDDIGTIISSDTGDSDMRKLSGLRAWSVQRLTAIYIAVYILFLLFHFVSIDELTYPQWHHWVASPLISVTLSIFVLSVLLHAWIGGRDIFIDYLHPMWLRLTALSLLLLGLLIAGFWFLLIILKVSLPGIL
jgi:succinate dehydrogenase / fumarate reductase membrane anchor subunit